MSQTPNSSAPGSGFGEGPIRVGGSSFSRPAALIGGAVALVALTAIATTLAIRPSAGDAGAGREAQIAASPLPDANTKVSGKTGDEAKPAPTESEHRAAPEHKPTTAKTPAPQKVAQAPAVVCSTCGTVESVTPVTQKGEGTGIGAVGGAVVGGLLGHQIGGGKGKDAMTAIGAVGGGLAGHEIEKRQRATTVYQVKVRMDDGTTRTVTQATAPTVGAKVTLEGSQLKARAS